MAPEQRRHEDAARLGIASSGGASGLMADTPLTAPAVAQIIGTFGTENANARKRFVRKTNFFKICHLAVTCSLVSPGPGGLQGAPTAREALWKRLSRPGGRFLCDLRLGRTRNTSIRVELREFCLNLGVFSKKSFRRAPRGFWGPVRPSRGDEGRRVLGSRPEEPG